VASAVSSDACMVSFELSHAPNNNALQSREILKPDELINMLFPFL
jgi:hypothetical protein